MQIGTWTQNTMSMEVYSAYCSQKRKPEMMFGGHRVQYGPRR